MLDTILKKYFTKNVQSGNDKEACKKPGSLWTVGFLTLTPLVFRVWMSNSNWMVLNEKWII